MTAEQKLNEILTLHDEDTNVDLSAGHFRKWLIEQFKNSNSKSNATRLEDFAVYFLNSIRQQTEIHLRCNENNVETPKCQTPVRALKPAAYTSDNINLVTPKRLLLGTIEQSITSTPYQQKTQHLHAYSLDDTSQRCDESLNTHLIPSTSCTRTIAPLENTERINNNSLKSNTSTPIRRTSSRNHSHNRRASSNSFNNSCHTTPPTSAEKSTRNSAVSSSICLGDFLTFNTASNRSHKKKQNNSNSQQNFNTNDSPVIPQTGNKPKKRVVPTTISDGRMSNNSAFGNNSAFSNENNILIMSNTEIDDRNKCAVLEARKSLKQNAIKISKELESSVGESKFIDVTANAAEATTQINNIELLSPIDLKNVQQPALIKKIAYIYATLIDLNFTTYVLNEISFLLNLLNANETEKQNETNESEVAAMKMEMLLLQIEPVESTSNMQLKPIELLRNVTNCVYFALIVLKLQRNTLAMLDLKSLGVVLHSERILALSQDLKEFLENAYHHKQNEIQKSKQQDKDSDFSVRLDNSSFNNVTYQEDKDSRQNFPSNNEFGAFKSQRDLFYKTLKCWESNHLSPTWNFQQEITPNIRDIFKLSEHAVNMAHFAKLFVSQLLISSNYASSPEEIGVDIDIQKFSKLTQRLLAPSKFSVDYQFPHNQAFFRDFIFESRSIAFLEQLKLTIYAQLIALNDSSYEMLNILKETNDEDDEGEAIVTCPTKFIVRPEVLSSMQLLAKFLGFVTVLPYNYNSSIVTSHASALDKKQVALRSLFQPNFNVSKLLQEALKKGKILITLPWLVQYLAMLDNVTLQLDNYVEVIQLLFYVYMHIASCEQETENDQPTVFKTTLFIIRCCLGWLFDTKPIIAEQYYTYRIIDDNKQESLVALTWHNACNNGAIKVHPMIESILNIACPFLAEFRVSIMPAKYSMAKYVSRTGRYRHITTRISQQRTAKENLEQIPNLNPKQTENKLIEAFLHSQNLTMRRLIEFIMERVYKSAVKDAQLKILLPSKAAADQKINEITSNKYAEVYQLVHEIYKEARLSAISQWNELVPLIINERITKALDALLQEDIEQKIKQIYFELIKRNTTTKVLQWRDANVFKTNFYCANFEDMAQKICKVNSKPQQTVTSSELRLVKTTPSVSTTLDELQFWLHCTSMRPELVQDNTKILKTLNTLPNTFENVLPTALYRVVSVSLIQLIQNIIARHPELMTTELIDAFNAIWLSKEMQRHAIVLHKQYQLESTLNDVDKMETASDNSDSNSVIIPNIFDPLITIAFIESMGSRHICYNKLHDLLITMIKVKIINVEFVNELFVRIFKMDWHPSVLNEISNMLTNIAKKSQKDCDDIFSTCDDGKSNLFMEVLAEFSRDVDDF